MSKPKSLGQQLDDMQTELNRLKELEKLFDKAVKLEFNKDIKQLHKQLNKSSNADIYWEQICNYFGLKSTSDMTAFVELMCTDQNLNYYDIHHNKKNVENRTERVAYNSERSEML